jgi:hypothetical protein
MLNGQSIGNWIGRCLLMGALFFSVGAGEAATLSSDGLNGEGATAIIYDPATNVTVVGTLGGLYYQKTPGAKWQRMPGFPAEKTAVRQICCDGDKNTCFVATQRGLFSFDFAEMKANNIFLKSSSLETDGLGIAVDFKRKLFLGTRGGLFVKKSLDETWVKSSGPFADRAIVSLCALDDSVYVASEEGVFRSLDSGCNWEKVFNVGRESVSLAEGDELLAEDTQGEEIRIGQIICLSKERKSIAILTSRGIFETGDDKNWSQWPLAGIDFMNARHLILDSQDGAPLVLTKTAVYKLKNNRWKKIAGVFDGQQMVLAQRQLFVAAKRGVWVLDLDKSANNETEVDGGAVDSKSCSKEPTVQEVQQMVISYSELSDRKIKDWRRRAGYKAFVPKVSVNIDKTVYGSSSGAFAVGPKDWGVGLSWDLAEFIYNDALTSIDSRAKLMIDQRNDVLAEVTRLYFERKSLMMDMDSGVDLNDRQKSNKELRLQEVVALIDRMTGGNYSKVLKRF